MVRLQALLVDLERRTAANGDNSTRMPSGAARQSTARPITLQRDLD